MADRPGSVPVQIGIGQYHVTEQPLFRVGRQLARIQELASAFSEDAEEFDIGGVILGLGDGLYDVVKAFIPDLMAKWEFNGFPSKEAYEAGEYDPDAAAAGNGPKLSQLLDLFDAILQVYDAPRLKAYLGKTPLAGYASRWVAVEMDTRLKELQARQAMAEETLSGPSLSSPSTNGDSPSESATTTLPTIPTPPLETVDSPPLEPSIS